MDDRESFRKAAIEYLRDDDAVTELHVQKRIADEIERLVKENARLVAENSQLKTELDDS